MYKGVTKNMRLSSRSVETPTVDVKDQGGVSLDGPGRAGRSSRSLTTEKKPGKWKVC